MSPLPMEVLTINWEFPTDVSQPRKSGSPSGMIDKFSVVFSGICDTVHMDHVWKSQICEYHIPGYPRISQSSAPLPNQPPGNVPTISQNGGFLSHRATPSHHPFRDGFSMK
jgi:hypothetical protein